MHPQRNTMSHETNQSRIFVVDDEYMIATTLAMILKASGFEATSFTKPFEALEQAEGSAPDLLISDIVMPEISGIDLAIRMQEKLPRMKVLLFSGQASTADLMEQARKGGHDFEVLTKPIHPTEFLKKISETTEAGRRV
jgi:DNA-binding NtrC family response regulator